MPSANTLVRWVNENAFAPVVRARPCPTFGRPVHLSGCAPADYGPALLLMPFGFHLTMDTLPSGITANSGCRSALAVSGFRLRARLGFSIPPALSGRRGVTPAFGYDTPHSSIRGTLTLLNNALLSAHYGSVRLSSPHQYSGSCGAGRLSFSLGIGATRSCSSVQSPEYRSRRLYAGHSPPSIQVSGGLVPRVKHSLGFCDA